VSINNLEMYLAAHFDFAPLKGCFGGTISPSDIDGIVERNGRFLTLEAKTGDAPVSDAADRMFKNRVKTGVDHVIVFWGDKDNPSDINSGWCVRRARIYRPNISPEEREVDLGGLRSLCEMWYRYANGGLYKFECDPFDHRSLAIATSEAIRSIPR